MEHGSLEDLHKNKQKQKPKPINNVSSYSSLRRVSMSDSHSQSYSQRNFESETERRRYMAQRRWRKLRLFLKASHEFHRRATYIHVSKDGSVFGIVKLLFAMPQFSLISLTMLINLQVILYYTDIGVTPSFLAFFQIFARSFDVLTDPLMAHISDNLTRTRFGRFVYSSHICII